MIYLVTWAKNLIGIILVPPLSFITLIQPTRNSFCPNLWNKSWILSLYSIPQSKPPSLLAPFIATASQLVSLLARVDFTREIRVKFSKLKSCQSPAQNTLFPSLPTRMDLVPSSLSHHISHSPAASLPLLQTQWPGMPSLQFSTNCTLSLSSEMPSLIALFKASSPSSYHPLFIFFSASYTLLNYLTSFCVYLFPQGNVSSLSLPSRM